MCEVSLLRSTETEQSAGSIKPRPQGPLDLPTPLDLEHLEVP